MKKFFALLMTVTILAGSAGMTASASVDPNVCEHPDNHIHDISYEYPYSSTTTHPAWVANKPNGDPILVTCTVTYTYQKYKRICSDCQHVFRYWEELISQTHSIHH